MKSPLKATFQLSLATLFTMAMGLISAKVLALVLGPSGLGVLGLLQAVVGFLSVVAGLGISTALVRKGASQHQAIGLIERSGLYLTAMWNLFLFLAWIFLGPHLLSRFGIHLGRFWQILLGLSFGFQSFANLQLAGLKLQRQVGAIARVSAISAVMVPLAMVVMVAYGHRNGVVPAITASAAMAFLIPWWVRRRLRPSPDSASAPEIRSGMRSLLWAGLPLMISALVGSSTKTAIPFMVQDQLGRAGVGFYMVGLTLSSTYLGFLSGTMSQEYFPRLSALKGKPRELVAAINRQQQVTLWISLPIVATVEIFAKWLVPLVWTARFGPAVPMIRWMVMADLLRFSSWSLSFVILSEYGGSLYLSTELLGGAATLTLSFFGLSFLGLRGLGMALNLKYALYLGWVWLICRKRLGFVWTRSNGSTLVLGQLLMFILLLVPINSSPLAAWIEIPLDGALILLSAHKLWRQWRASESRPTRAESSQAL